MGIFSRVIEKKMIEQIRNEPAAQAVIRAIENWGIYDYSENAKNKAARAYDMLKRLVGDSPDTKNLYENTLRTSGLPIPLCAVYAFVVTSYINPGFWDPAQTKLQQSQQNAKVIGVFFPKYQRFVEQRHGGAESIAILAISNNYLDDYLN